METTNTHFLDKALKGLHTAVNELEDFQIQLSLGKAEASDKYALIKKKFDGIIHDTKVKLDEGKEKAKGLKKKFEELEQLFITDKVATVEAIKEEKQKFLKAVDEIETDFKSTLTKK